MTPLGTQPPRVVSKVMLKAVCKGASKEAKLFTLRNVMQSNIISCDNKVTVK